MIKGELFFKMMVEYDKEICSLQDEIKRKKDVTIVCNRTNLLTKINQVKKDNREAEKLQTKLKALKREKELFVLTTTGEKL